MTNRRFAVIIERFAVGDILMTLVNVEIRICELAGDAVFGVTSDVNIVMLRIVSKIGVASSVDFDTANRL